MDRIKESAKAVAALVGSVATALLAVYASDTPVGKVLTVVAIVATAVGTWAVPNQPAANTAEPELAQGDEAAAFANDEP
jgi:CBS-domain-containing membrane protein